eukprot:m.116589 g.116589  ORF g.116589 m.116589 type:complete len:88 (-) comp51945_c0_seq2:663-926(-)
MAEQLAVRETDQRPDEQTLIVRIVLAGAGEVGKSSLLRALQYPPQPFEEVYQPTIGVEFSTRGFIIHDCHFRVRWSRGSFKFAFVEF